MSFEDNDIAASNHEALKRRIDDLDKNLEQALVAAEDAQAEASVLAEERAGLQTELYAANRRNADLADRLAKAEEEQKELRLSLRHAESQLRGVHRSEEHLNEELRASYEELQILAAELEEANTDLERRIAERTAQLAESEATLRLITDNIPAQISCFDRAQRCIFANPEQARFRGTTREALLGRTMRDHLGERVYARLRPYVERALAGEAVTFEDKEPDKFGPGRDCWTEENYIPRRAPDGTVDGFFTLVLDITERKLAEEALTRAKEAAETANRAKTRFLAAASHDLRQPIQAAALYAHVLRASLPSDPMAEEALELLKACIDNLNGMLSGLLDLSRLDAGAVDVRIVDFVPDALMQRLAAEFHGVAQVPGLELRCVAASTPVATDPQLLERILRNLLSNAITHGAPADTTGRRGRVLFGCRRRGSRVEFQVWDRGPGIPDDAQDSIFEEFRQLKNPERNPTQGFGLGLSIVSRIARLLGLEVSVRSTVGRGSVFSVTVPCGRAAQPVHSGAPSADADQGPWLKGRTVLLVEDDERVRRGLSMMLKRWGARVVDVASVEELAAALPRLPRRPHVMLTDYRLPGGATGGTVVELVRRRWDVPGVIITGDTAPERLREARSLGCHLLCKPVEPAELVQALTRAMHA
jgi:PAS domain S-box